MITLVIGGARSGKSATAERLVAEQAGDEPVTYLATGVVRDDDFAARVRAHQDRRPAAWRTVECSSGLPQALGSTEGPVLVDSLGTWVAAGYVPDDDPTGPTSTIGTGPAATGPTSTIGTGPAATGPTSTIGTGSAATDLGALRLALAARATLAVPTVLVTEEVGLGVHPETAIGRRFRDELGAVNVMVADLADDVLLVVAGRIFRPVDR